MSHKLVKAGVCTDRLYPTGIGAKDADTKLNCLTIDSAGKFIMAGYTESNTLNTLSTKKAFYAVYEETATAM